MPFGTTARCSTLSFLLHLHFIGNPSRRPHHSPSFCSIWHSLHCSGTILPTFALKDMLMTQGCRSHHSCFDTTLAQCSGTRISWHKPVQRLMMKPTIWSHFKGSPESSQGEWQRCAVCYILPIIAYELIGYNNWTSQWEYEKWKRPCLSLSKTTVTITINTVASISFILLTMEDTTLVTLDIGFGLLEF